MCSAFKSAIFLRPFSNMAKDIYCLKILDEFHYGSSASLNRCMMDHLMNRLVLAFLSFFF